MRLLRASRVMKRLEIRISLPYATLTVILLTAQILLSSPFAACLLGMQAPIFATPLRSWQATCGFCTCRNLLRRNNFLCSRNAVAP